MRLLHLQLRSLYLRFVFVTYGQGTVGKKNKMQCPDVGGGTSNGPHLQYGWDFPEEILEKFSGKTRETLSERFLGFPSRVRLGSPKAYNSRQLRLPENFQNSLPPSTAGGVSFFRSGSGEGLSELVMEFPAVLRGFLK